MNVKNRRLTSPQIAQKLHDHANWLESIRVSQDGWAKVAARAADDAKDLALAIDAGKIVAHVSDHPKYK